MRRGETVALVVGVGVGQVRVGALDGLSLLPGSAHVEGSVLYDGAEMVGAPEKELRRVRGNDISFIFQEPMTSLNPLHTIEKQLTESLEAASGAGRRRAALEARSSSCWKRSASATPKAGWAPIRTSCRAGSASG